MKKRFRVTSLACAIAVLLAISLTGCESKNAAATDSSNSGSSGSSSGITLTSEKITLRFAGSDDSSSKKEITAFAKAFEKLHPNITVTYEPLSGDYAQKLTIEASSNTLPDVCWLADVQTAQFATKGILMDLTPYFAKFNISKDDFYPAMLKTGQINGKQYMIPRDYNHVVCYYNVKMFKAAGVDVPQDGWSWDDFVSTARKFVKKDGNKITQYGCEGQITWQATILPMIIGLGGTITDPYPNGTSANFNTKGTVQALTTLKELVDEGVFVNQCVEGVPGFSSGKVAMMFGVRPHLSGNIENLGADNLGCVTFPALPTHVVGSGASGYAVPASTTHKNEAAALCFYIVSSDGQKVFEKTGDSIPIRKSLANDSTWRNIPSSNSEYFSQDAFVDHPEYDIVPLSCSISDRTKGNAFDAAWLKAIQALFLGQKTPAEAAEYGQEEIQEALSD